MSMQHAYIIIDIGTGNVRVAVTAQNGEILAVAREDIAYVKDSGYPEALYFEPALLWEQVCRLTKYVLADLKDVRILAITAASQREGIVLISQDGRSLIGLPNIDHRGRGWEGMMPDKSRVYALTGRYPTSLFSALKLVAIRETQTDIWEDTHAFLSISNWVEFQLSGVVQYEHSQASETLLYDIAKKDWSSELCVIFGIPMNLLPPLVDSATVIGNIRPDAAAALGLPADVQIITGGGDTQLAVKSTRPALNDMVIISGTTTPILKLTGTYQLDTEERTWTSRDIEPERFVFEANTGVTGLNYQRLKEIFYPNEGYEIIEQELAANEHTFCMASLGSLLADEDEPLIRGGFIFPTPVSHLLTRSAFVWATMIDIACSIARNYHVLAAVDGHSADYIWACGGGLQSVVLRQLIANLTGKKIQIRTSFQHATAIGGALICNQALQLDIKMNDQMEVIHPRETERHAALFAEWEKTRGYFRRMQS